ncbi:MAG: PHP domain-containing protein [Bacteroidota bacterium]|nr:PHP domain-containing protein [Bacteroidota bacterium]
MNIWTEISEKLKSETTAYRDQHECLKVNAHIHTSYSFSSFDSIDSIVAEARKENIKVLGINDFNTVDGYPEWAVKCYKAGILPLFNIEMIGLSHIDMKKGHRVNDPNNPGRTYISGKALAYPLKLSPGNELRLKHIRDLSNEHVRLMTHKVNDLLDEIDDNLMIDFDKMLHDHTLGMARERHLAAMIRREIENNHMPGKDRDEIFFTLLGNDYIDIKNGDNAQLENLIRFKLLKAGGAAFVEEDPEIFIEPDEIRDLILDAKGIPTYPFLADFNKGRYTDFEADRERAASSLFEQGFYSVEFIPARNDYQKLRDYVAFLYGRGFIITFGTEHNSPGVKPLEVKAAGSHDLDDFLLRVNYEGACIMAAHQYLVATNRSGYLDENRLPKISDKKAFIELGNRIIKTIRSLSS